MNVAFICDSGYVMQTTVAITSLILTKSATTTLDIAVIYSGLDQTQQQDLCKLEQKNVTINLIDGTPWLPGNLIELSKSSLRAATKTALLKFYLAEMLPSWNRVLYLDGDLIVRRDLTELYAVNLDNHYAAVVRDLPQVLYKHPILGETRDYFNTGVMVLNLERMRANCCSEQLIKARINCPDDSLVDQNTFNKVFGSEVVQLHQRYNVCCMNMQRRWHREHMCKKINSLYQTNYKNFDDLINESAIIHFSSNEKPWKYYDVIKAKEWDMVYRKTIYSNICLFRKSYWKHRRLQQVSRFFSVR